MTPAELNALESELYRTNEQVRGSLVKMEHSLRNDGEIPMRYVAELGERLQTLKATTAKVEAVHEACQQSPQEGQ